MLHNQQPYQIQGGARQSADYPLQQPGFTSHVSSPPTLNPFESNNKYAFSANAGSACHEQPI